MSGFKSNSLLAGATVLFALSGMVSAELPDPNPEPQDDGTWVWYVGNNTQYPVIQDVLDACSDGDEIVVTAGLYVESLEVNNNNITLRPFCEPRDIPNGILRDYWADVTFWNPTEGFNNANGYAIRMTGASNSYIGAPREVTELSNGIMFPATVMPGEYAASPGTLRVLTRDVTDYTNGSGIPGSPNRLTMTFWSRSLDNVAVYSVDGLGTFQNCAITSENGFGGGVILEGDSNMTQFVGCNFNATYSIGLPLRLADGSFGPPVNVVTIQGAGRPQFMNCDFTNNWSGAGSDGMILDIGSETTWSKCNFTDNFGASCSGIYACYGGTPQFNRCLFENLDAQKGTVYWDSTGLSAPDSMNFYRCNFKECRTSDSMRGAVAWVDCEDCQDQTPLITLSDCGFENNQGSSPAGPVPNITPPGGSPMASWWTEFDVWSPYFPMFRIGQGLSYASTILIADAPLGSPGDINGDGVIDALDVEELSLAIGTCPVDTDFNGVIDIEDLLGVIAAYGSSCP